MARWNRRQFLKGLMAAVAPMTPSLAEAGLHPHGSAIPSTDPSQPATLSASVVSPRSVPVARSASSSSSGSQAEEQHTAAAHADRAEVQTRPALPSPDGTLHRLGEILPPGQRFGRWRIVAVHPVKLGAVPVILATRRGTRFQVDVMRREETPRARRGISETQHYALYLSNVGRGSTPTPEEHGLGVMGLAALLRTREHQVPQPRLLTLRDRLGRFPQGRFDCLRDTAMDSPPDGSATG